MSDAPNEAPDDFVEFLKMFKAEDFQIWKGFDKTAAECADRANAIHEERCPYLAEATDSRRYRTEYLMDKNQRDAEIERLRADRDQWELLSVDLKIQLLKANARNDFLEDVFKNQSAAIEEYIDMKAENTRLREALRGVLELGRKDTSNPKYEGYYDAARAALEGK